MIILLMPEKNVRQDIILIMIGKIGVSSRTVACNNSRPGPNSLGRDLSAYGGTDAGPRGWHRREPVHGL